MAPLIPVHADPSKAEQAKREAEKRGALKVLESLVAQSLALTRHVFFVPGWAGEDGICWMGPYDDLLPGHAPVKAWIERIMPPVIRAIYVHYMRFSQQESQQCRSFLDFAVLLKQRIRQAMPAGGPMDLIGHSMGSLDNFAAIMQGPNPLLHVVNCVAVGSPLQGIFYGDFVQAVDELLPMLHWELHHYAQVRNLDYDSTPIRYINALATRQLLLDRVQRLYTIEGTQDMVVMRSARFLLDGLDQTAKKRVVRRAIGGATHVGSAGVTQDPRTVLTILKVLAGLPV